jgi:hypothetical protein
LVIELFLEVLSSPKKEPAMRLETVEDEFENDKELKELSLYKKLVV